MLRLYAVWGGDNFFLFHVCTAPSTLGSWSKTGGPNCYVNINNKIIWEWGREIADVLMLMIMSTDVLTGMNSHKK